ncbi:unnamed protein product [Victoria cruziana]
MASPSVSSFFSPFLSRSLFSLSLSLSLQGEGGDGSSRSKALVGAPFVLTLARQGPVPSTEDLSYAQTCRLRFVCLFSVVLAAVICASSMKLPLGPDSQFPITQKQIECPHCH